jgi:hypothetical protein
MINQNSKVFFSSFCIIVFYMVTFVSYIFKDYTLMLTFSLFLAMLLLKVTAIMRRGFSFPLLFLFFSLLYIISPLWDALVVQSGTYDLEISAFIAYHGINLLLFYTIFCNLKVVSSKLPDFKEIFNCNKVRLILICSILSYLLLLINDVGLQKIFVMSRGEWFLSKSTSLNVLKMIVPISICFYIPFLKKDQLTLIDMPILLLLGVYLFMELFVLGDRRLLLGIISFYLYINFSDKKFSFKAKTLVCLFIVLFILMGFVRSKPLNEWVGVFSDLELVSIINPANLEFGYAGKVGQDILKKDGKEYIDISLVSSIQTLVPKIFYENRPLGPAQAYSAKYHPDIWAEGGAFGYNFVVELYRNLSFLGPIIFGVIFGLFCSIMLNNKNITYNFIVNVVLFNTSLYLIRLDSASWYKFMLINIILISLFAVFTKKSSSR